MSEQYDPNWPFPQWDSQGNRLLPPPPPRPDPLKEPDWLQDIDPSPL